MNILLLEKRNGKNHRPNLALARFSTLHRNNRDNVFHYVVDSKSEMPDFEPDKVYVSIVFSWDAPYLANYIDDLKKKYPKLNENGRIVIGGVAPYYMKDYILDNFNVVPYIACSKELDNVIPDPEFYNNDSTYVFTMRSCPNGCSWCVVPHIEKEPYIIENWKDQINMKVKNVVICDNNIFTAPIEHRRNVFGYLEKIAHKNGVRIEGSRKIRTVEFDGGYDWRNMTDENIDLIRNIKHNKIRIAWDDVRFEKGFDKAVNKLLEAFPEKSKRGLHENIECFVLYNCPHTKDTLEDTLYRAYKLYYHYGIFPYLMRFQPLNTLKYKTYLSPYWNEFDCMDVGRWANNRIVFLKVPNYKYYVGRKDDGATLSKGIDQDTLIRSMQKDKFHQIGIDFAKSFKENLNVLKNQLQEREELLGKKESTSVLSNSVGNNFVVQGAMV